MLKPTIGIEVHAQLNTKMKAFSCAGTDFNSDPNTNVTLVDLGYPGTLPKLNKEVMDMALKAALALNCEISTEMHFDRKNYFYPDLPKGYQITQSKTPIGKNGYVEIEVNGTLKKIGIERIHIEEDTAKSIHTGNGTYLNFNRAGIPLIEIVTKPDIKSELEAMKYIEALREMLLYLEISDVKMEEGSMRCDANVSLAEEGAPLGIKSEIKNIGSISAVGTSILFEIKRQTKLLSEGATLKEETRRYDDTTGETVLMRIKETGNDYRYFPEPDLGIFKISEEWLKKARDEMPIFPKQLRLNYKSEGLNDIVINALVSNLELNKLYIKVKDSVDNIKAANILAGDVLSYLNKENIKLSETNLSALKFKDLMKALDEGIISGKQSKELIPYLIKDEASVSELISKLGMAQMSDTSALEIIINKVVETNADSVNDFKEGKDRAIKFLMGQIMKESKGSANPKVANDLLMQILKQK